MYKLYDQSQVTADYERGFFNNTKYDVLNEPEIEKIFNADIITNKSVGFCDAAHENNLQIVVPLLQLFLL